MSHLRPCTTCDRHVRADETRCPFCDATLAIDDRTPAVGTARLGRAARMAFGAALATASLAACGGTQTQPGGANTADAGATATDAASGSNDMNGTNGSIADTGVSTPPPPPPDWRNRGGGGDYGGPAKPYGAPPADGLIV